jgi:hypothetical protein
MKRLPISLLVLAGAVTFGCGGEKPAPAATPAARATAAAPAATLAPAVTTATAGDIGIPECDDFLKKYETCVSDHVPAATKAQFQAGLDQWRKTWKSIAAQPAARASLVTACQQALDNTKQATSVYGCKW